MDPFFSYLQDAILADDDDDDLMTSLGGVILPPPAPGTGSAFTAYQQQGSASETSSSLYHPRTSGGANMHRRMFGYLRRIGEDASSMTMTTNVMVEDARSVRDAATTTTQAPPTGSSTRRFRHITRERLRRERLSQGFADLHALLPPGASSKGGKNDIVGAAAGYIADLEGRKQRLRARNQDLLLLLDHHHRHHHQVARTRSGSGSGVGMVVKVRAESAAVNVFETVLRRLKAMEDMRVTGIRSCFRDDGGGMWMDVGVECEISYHDADRAIANALKDLHDEENTPGMQLPRRPAFSCQVERGVPMR